MSEYRIDAVDYGILKCIEDHDNAWKKRVHNLLPQYNDTIPGLTSISVQTVGRRINSLQEHGLVESCILSPDDINRDLIIGYAITEKGTRAVQRKRENFLREQVMQVGQHLLGNQNVDDIDLDHEALVSLMCDEFDIDEQTRTDIVADCSTTELAAILAIYYFRDNFSNLVAENGFSRLGNLIQATPKLRETFGQQSAVEKLFAAANAGRGYVSKAKSIRG